jgi:hypothetical protein
MYRVIKQINAGSYPLKKTTDFTKKVLFSVKWQFMPQQKRYAYLWARTRKSWSQTSLVRETEHTEPIVGG